MTQLEGVQPEVMPTTTPQRTLAEEWGMLCALWRRDLLRLRKEPSRWLGLVLQPIVFWLMLGFGFGSSISLPGTTDGHYLHFFFPGALVMLVLFTSIFATMSVIEDRQSGFLQAVLCAPGSRASMIGGKLLGVVSVTLIQVMLFLIGAPFAGVELASVNWLSLFGAIVLLSSGLTAANFAIAWRLNSTQAYHALMSIALLPLWVMSGALFPPRAGWLHTAMLANPLAHGTAAIRLSLAPETTTLTPLGLGASFLWLGVFGAVAFVFALRATRRS
ncbi:MAG: ABC transporter permease [Myxococcales bacterium]|nr:ABC transporter permease [Myxococcales bacterium]